MKSENLYRSRDEFDAVMLGTLDTTWLGGNAKFGYDHLGNPQVTVAAPRPFEDDAYAGVLRVTFEWDGSIAFVGTARMKADDSLDREFTIARSGYLDASREGIEEGIEWLKGLLKACEYIATGEDYEHDPDAEDDEE